MFTWMLRLCKRGFAFDAVRGIMRASLGEADVTSEPPRRNAQAARERILAAARRMFAAYGYEATTVRTVAAEATINPALVIRYFGSKEALFAAAVQFDLRLPDPARAPREQIGEQMVAHFIDRWEEPASQGELQALLRAGINHAVARERLLAIFRDQLTTTIAAIAGANQAGVRAGLVATQMLGFALARYVLCLPDVAAMDRDAIIKALGPTIERYLMKPLD